MDFLTLDKNFVQDNSIFVQENIKIVQEKNFVQAYKVHFLLSKVNEYEYF